MSVQSFMILKKCGVNITKPRILILDAIIHAEQSLDLQHLLHDRQHRFERTTLFRTLRMLIQNKIIYQVSADGTTKYIMHKQYEGRSPSDDHSTFLCMSCRKAIPLVTIAAPRLKIPEGFKIKKLEIIVHGLCPACKS
ncbi:MAG TPA: transcriptional repressor [Puia sp.]|nr:transcriptional repressor [Puia sp.]